MTKDDCWWNYNWLTRHNLLINFVKRERFLFCYILFFFRRIQSSVLALGLIEL